MPVNWDELNNELDEIIENCADETDQQLASKISSITRLTDDEIQELFPVPGDIKKLTKLMEIVQAADERNTKINNIVANAEEFGGIVLTLLSKFA